MKKKIKELVDDLIKKLNVYVDDAFVEIQEGENVLCIVLDSDEVIDLNRVTDASRIINKKLDQQKELLKDIAQVDIYSKEKGDN